MAGRQHSLAGRRSALSFFMETSRHAADAVTILEKNPILPPGMYLIEPSSEEKTVGGLVIPGSTVTREGKLVMAGEPVLRFPDIPKGSKVYYMQTNSLEITWKEKKYFIVSYRDIRLAFPPSGPAAVGSYQFQGTAK